MDFTDVLTLWPILLFGASFAFPRGIIAAGLRATALMAVAAIPETPSIARIVFVVAALGLFATEIFLKNDDLR